jgi:hypothetical protein
MNKEIIDSGLQTLKHAPAFVHFLWTKARENSEQGEKVRQGLAEVAAIILPRAGVAVAVLATLAVAKELFSANAADQDAE